MSLEKVAKEPEDVQESEENLGKLTTSKLAKKLGLKTNELVDKLISQGFLEIKDDKNYITSKGKDAGGEFRMSPKFGPYFLWPEGLVV
jgi:Mn-dependent DtxR family transcriptional regulator